MGRLVSAAENFLLAASLFSALQTPATVSSRDKNRALHSIFPQKMCISAPDSRGPGGHESLELVVLPVLAVLAGEAGGQLAGEQQVDTDRPRPEHRPLPAQLSSQNQNFDKQGEN